MFFKTVFSVFLESWQFKFNKNHLKRYKYLQHGQCFYSVVISLGVTTVLFQQFWISNSDFTCGAKWAKWIESVKMSSDMHDSYHIHLRDIYRGPLNIVWMNLELGCVCADWILGTPVVFLLPSSETTVFKECVILFLCNRMHREHH